MRRELVVMGWLLALSVAFAQADAAARTDQAQRLAANLTAATSTLQIGLDTAEDDTSDVPPLFPAPDPFADLGTSADGAPLPPPQQPVAEPAPASWKQSGPPSFAASEILSNAQALLGVPYVWGGNTTSGMDCSAYVSKTWGLSRQTTDTLPQYSRPITKDELLPGDAMNLTTGRDPRGYGHIRLFAAWANEDHSRMWVFEETPRQSLYHVIAYDDRYQPIRRTNFTTSDTVAPLIPAPTPTPRPQQTAAPSATRTSRDSASRNNNRDEVASLLSKATPTAAPAAQDLRSTTVVVTVTPRYIPTPEPVRRTPTPLPWREPTPFPTPRVTSTPVSTPAPTATPRSTSTPTPTPTVRPTATVAPTMTATAAPTATATPHSTSTPSPTPTSTATPVAATATPTATSTAHRRRFGQ